MWSDNERVDFWSIAAFACRVDGTVAPRMECSITAIIGQSCREPDPPSLPAIQQLDRGDTTFLSVPCETWAPVKKPMQYDVDLCVGYQCRSVLDCICMAWRALPQRFDGAVAEFALHCQGEIAHVGVALIG